MEQNGTIGFKKIQFAYALGMLRVGERRLVMQTMLQMENKLAKGDNPLLSSKVCN